ncbi:cobalamin-dependent protein [Embleya sp. NPDC059237]|uniref:cobalamin-dependent protein n=1 Tax=Embleya sp. NPDC059237 TaxID=3346784 RepID=UPI00368C46F9
MFVNAPLRDYTVRPRVNDYTLPVLGMAYIATYARHAGHNVGLLDAEAHGLGIDESAAIVNRARPRWAGFNLLAPTYALSARIAHALDPDIKIMVGGHHAKAMPGTVLCDPRFERLTALVLGEGETRVAALLDDHTRRAALPQVMWRDPHRDAIAVGSTVATRAPGCPRTSSNSPSWTARSCPRIPTGRPTAGWRPTSSARAAAPTTAASAAPQSP